MFRMLHNSSDGPKRCHVASQMLESQMTKDRLRPCEALVWSFLPVGMDQWSMYVVVARASEGFDLMD